MVIPIGLRLGLTVILVIIMSVSTLITTAILYQLPGLCSDDTFSPSNGVTSSSMILRS